MTSNQEAETWRYEVRGSSLYDNHEQRNLSIHEAGEILNAHQALLMKEGRWAAKAGLAEQSLTQERQKREEAETKLAQTTVALMGADNGLRNQQVDIDALRLQLDAARELANEWKRDASADTEKFVELWVPLKLSDLLDKLSAALSEPQQT